MKKAVATLMIAMAPAVSTAGYIKDSDGNVDCQSLQQITWAVYHDAEKGIPVNDEINKVVQMTGEHPGEMQTIVKQIYKAQNDGYTQMQVGDNMEKACNIKKDQVK